MAVSGGAGDSLLGTARAAGVDVFLTADLRHHPASEFVETGGPALIDATNGHRMALAAQRGVHPHSGGR
ncbi:Nif3-like dinuclear metal center hexameric protein [Nonomuraea dietziae]|uniref:Nif3-like dinuclear metal center hexameric protein n=1 Tax=Nonomuraea dietziae TaxID=65515 RepID=UPI003CD072A0